MPCGLKRYYGDGDLHFLTFSCYRRQPLLGLPANRDLFLKVLENVRRRYRFVVLGYVVMPEQVHLLISEPEKKNPSVLVQALKLGFARRLLGAPPAATGVSPLCLITLRVTSGKHDSMISTCGPTASASKSWNTCIEIRSSVGLVDSPEM